MPRPTNRRKDHTFTRSAFGWLLPYDVLSPLDEDLPPLGYDALAAALQCDVDELPRMKRLPVVPQMLAARLRVSKFRRARAHGREPQASFVGALLYLPTLHVIACCGNRCKMVCGLKGYYDAQTAVIVSDKIWTSYKIRRPISIYLA